MSEKMAVRVEGRPRSTLEEFAVKHGLTMVVRERSAVHGFPEGHVARWYAAFDRTEIRSGECFLMSAYGNGRTPEEAIANYGPAISEKLLIVNAGAPDRREIQVPIIDRATPLDSALPEPSLHPDPSPTEKP